jgi:hypothetical protein
MSQSSRSKLPNPGTPTAFLWTEAVAGAVCRPRLALERLCRFYLGRLIWIFADFRNQTRGPVFGFR